MEKEQKKRLSAKEVAVLLGIPLVKVQRWVHQGKIPCKYNKSKTSEYYFKQNEIKEWARSHNFTIIKNEQGSNKKESETNDFSLLTAIKRGGVFHDLEGDDIFTVLKNAIDRIEFPVTAERDLILDEIIFRESIASTGIGKGVAIPHLKDVKYLDLPYPIIPVFFLRKSIDFNSIDGKPVFVLFFIFTPSPEFHLKILSRLSYCLHNPEFASMLKDGVDMDQLLAKVEEIEQKIG